MNTPTIDIAIPTALDRAVGLYCTGGLDDLFEKAHHSFPDYGAPESLNSATDLVMEGVTALHASAYPASEWAAIKEELRRFVLGGLPLDRERMRTNVASDI